MRKPQEGGRGYFLRFFFGFLESLQGGGLHIRQKLAVSDEIIIEGSADKLELNVSREFTSETQ